MEEPETVPEAALTYDDCNSSECTSKSEDTTDDVCSKYVCFLCDQQFVRIVQLRGHMKQHAADDTLELTEDGGVDAIKLSNTRKGARANAEWCKRAREFRCSHCRKVFSHLNSLERHMTVHTGEKPFKCMKCLRNFSQTSSLSAHVKKFHSGNVEKERSLFVKKEPKKHECPVCGKIFLHHGGFQAHLVTHTGEKNFKCDVCGKAFATRSTRDGHLIVHSGLKPFSCPVCSKAFARTCDVKVHMRTHTGEKPFKCPSCDMAFTQSVSLKLHMQRHTGDDNPYQCHLCSRRFQTIYILKRHVETHVEKPGKRLLVKPYTDQDGSSHSSNGSDWSHSFSSQLDNENLSNDGSANKSQYADSEHSSQEQLCKRCGVMLDSGAGLKDHDCERETESSPLICLFCNSTFQTSSSLKSHMRQHV